MVKNLLFDLGGVIMDIDKERCIRSFAGIGMPEPRRFFGEYSQQGPFKLLEEGLMTVEEFHVQVREAIPRPVMDEEIDRAFNSFLLGIPVARLRALRALAGDYNVCLLSNTNPVMWHSAIRDYFAVDGLCREDYFPGGMVTSFEARSLKPDSRIFEYAARELGIKPEETFFLDDSRSNTAAAEALGFKAAVVGPDAEFTDILRQCGLRVS